MEPPGVLTTDVVRGEKLHETADGYHLILIAGARSEDNRDWLSRKRQI